MTTGDSIHETGWYVLRYQHLTSSLQLMLDEFKCRQQEQDVAVEYFMPMYNMEVTLPSGQTKVVERPKIPGFIFVRCDEPTAVLCAEECFIGLQRKHCNRFSDTTVEGHVCIPEEEMEVFRLAASRWHYQMEIFSADDIDLEKDDRVRILEGEFRGREGFLKTERGKDGGIVVMQMDNLCFTVRIEASKIGVVAFAKGNKHFYKKLEAARVYVDDAMRSFKKARALSRKQLAQLTSYYQRFGAVRLDTDAQKAKHLLMLYRIYTILQMDVERDKVRQQLEEKVIPAYRAKKEVALRRGQETVVTNFREFMKQKREADDAPGKHIKANAYHSTRGRRHQHHHIEEQE